MTADGDRVRICAAKGKKVEADIEADTDTDSDFENKQKRGEEEMTVEEIQKKIDEAVEKAVSAALDKQSKTFAKEKETTDAKLKELETENETLKKGVAEKEEQSHFEECDRFAKSLMSADSEEIRISPAIYNKGLARFLASLDRVTKHTFAQGQKPMTQLDWAKGTCSEMAKLNALFSEESADTEDEIDEEREHRASAKHRVTEPVMISMGVRPKEKKAA